MASLLLTSPSSGRSYDLNEDPRVVGESVVLIFRVPNYNSADARDGILLPVVIDYNSLH